MADASALSLGRMQGTPLIGRALQVTVPVSLQPDEDLSCVRAELQQPEMAPIPLSWRLDRIEGGGLLRLSSTAAVQEPIITVKVVVGCNDQFTQGYVLLADPPPLRESVPLVVAAPPPAAAPATPAPAPRSAGRAAPTTVTTPEGFRLETTLPARAAAAPAPAPATAREPTQEARRAARRPACPVAKAPPPSKPPAASGRPRLQVDLLDIAIDQAPALKVSTQLAQPAAGGMTRTEAAAAWQQINSPPEQQLAAKEPSEAIQAELKALREQTRRQAELLQQMQDERNLARDLLAALAGAIALGLGVLLWRRSRDTGGSRPWWQKERAEAGPVAAPADSSFVDSSVPEEDPPVRVAPEPDSGWAVPSSRTAAAGAKGADSGYGRSRLPSAEELLDVQEKANFFLAIGQPEKAIELLESRLLEHLGSSPFLWLDLLDLCRRLGRAADYERVRKEFQKVFAARMPPFEEAEPNTEGLEHYPKALSRIELLWPSSKVLKEIEKSLFQDPAPGSIMFDLEASRDLLLLYSVALEVVTSREDGTPYDRTQVAALDGEAPHTTEPVPLMALDSEAPPEDESVDLDLDFSMLDTASVAVATAAAQPQVAQPPAAADEPPAAPHEIEWETPELPAVTPPEPAAAADAAPSEDAAHEPMLPELDLGSFQPRAAAQAAPTVAESGEEGVLAPLQLDELKLDALPPADDQPPPSAAVAVADNGLDFNLDLDPAEPERTQVK